MRSPLCIFLSLVVILAVVAPASFSAADGAEPAGLPPNTSNGLRLLEEMQTVITELAETAKPSVVSLFPISLGGKSREFAQERAPNAPGSGAGVIITPDGHIITNNHVVGDATEIEVRLSDKSKMIAFFHAGGRSQAGPPIATALRRSRSSFHHARRREWTIDKSRPAR